MELPGATAVEFRETAHSIAAGVPYEGVATEGSSILVKCGAQSSAAAANEFFAGLSDGNVLGERGPELNFAIVGTLTVKFRFGVTRTLEDLRLGLGHGGWLVASRDCRRASGTWLACEDSGISFLLEDGHFKLQELSERVFATRSPSPRATPRTTAAPRRTGARPASRPCTSPASRARSAARPAPRAACSPAPT